MIIDRQTADILIIVRITFNLALKVILLKELTAIIFPTKLLSTRQRAS